MAKKQIWYEVEESETIEQCLERMKKDGYMPVGRKEEPLFQIINGEPVPIRQIIKFKGMPFEQE
ncbi:NETI motif-containing protein [Rummeliibacillus sp. BSL5]